MKYLFTHLLVFLLGILMPSISSYHIQFFRKYYTYIEEFDAFYKIHWDINGLSWNMAFLACDDEGATLFYPKAEGEWTLVNNLRNKMTETPNVTEIFVGFHNKFRLPELMTVDGFTTPYPLLVGDIGSLSVLDCITMDIETGVFQVDSCYQTLDTLRPFVCKKVENESCPTIDRNYVYSKSLRKCYKIHKKPKMWHVAMKTCFLEGGMLAILYSCVKVMADSGVAYFVGVQRSYYDDNFYTVKGQKVSKMSRNKKSTGKPNNCGAIIIAGDRSFQTTSADCFSELPFICEMEVQQGVDDPNTKYEYSVPMHEGFL